MAKAKLEATGPRILAFPRAGNLYPEILYAEVEAQGATVVEGVWTARWVVQNLRPGDMVHIHWPSFLYLHPTSRLRTTVRLARLYLLLLYARLRGARVVWTAHDLFPHDSVGSEIRTHRLGRRIITGLADYICVHGRSAADVVSRELGVHPSRMRIGHHGHFIGYYPNTIPRHEARERLGIRPEEFLYLFIGRCRPYKGLEDLIAAFAHAPQPSRLLIAGNFLSEDYLTQVRSLAAAAQGVDLVPGSIPDDELQVFLNAADCVVLPYRAILTSGTAMLALSFGRPVIAPDLGAMRDHVDSRCGLLYSAEEPQALAQALREIRSTKFDAEEIIERARRFSWLQPARQLIDILHAPRSRVVAERNT